MPTMQITGASVGTIDLNDDVNCQIAQAGWIPAVSRRRRGVLGNKSIYEDVVEIIPLRVFSEHATPATARQQVMDWVHNLASAMDQAETWREGMGTADAVLFEFEADGSSLANPLKATILGIPDGAPSVLEFQGSFNNGLRVFEMFIELKFKRRGAWLGDEDTDTGLAVENPDLMSATLSGSVELPSPTKIEIDFSDSASPDGLNDGFILISDVNDLEEFDILHAPTAVVSTSGPWSNVSDSTNHAYNTTVKRFTPSSTEDQQVLLSHTIDSGSAKGYHWFACVRNNSTTRSYQLSLQKNLYSTQSFQLRPVAIGPEYNYPQVIYLGMYATSSGVIKSGEITLVAKVDSTAGSGALDINYFAIIPVSETSHIMSVNEMVLSSLTIARLDHSALTRPNPIFQTVSSTDGPGEPASQGGSYVHTRASVIQAAVLMPKNEYWVFGRDVADVHTPWDLVLTATRRPAYLVPV